MPEPDEKVDDTKPEEAAKADDPKVDDVKPEEAAKADDKKAEEPKADDNKADEKKAEEEPKADEKKAEEEPKADEKKAEEPKADEKKAEEPKADEKKAEEEPKADEKKAEEPKADEEKPAEEADKSDTNQVDQIKGANALQAAYRVHVSGDEPSATADQLSAAFGQLLGDANVAMCSVSDARSRLTTLGDKPLDGAEMDDFMALALDKKADEEGSFEMAAMAAVLSIWLNKPKAETDEEFAAGHFDFGNVLASKIEEVQDTQVVYVGHMEQPFVPRCVRPAQVSFEELAEMIKQEKFDDVDLAGFVLTGTMLGNPTADQAEEAAKADAAAVAAAQLLVDAAKAANATADDLAQLEEQLKAAQDKPLLMWGPGTIGESLEKGTKVQTLSLRGAKLDGTCGKALANIVKTASSLKSLSCYSASGLSLQAALDMTAALQGNTTLESLDLSLNPTIGNAGAFSLAETLRVNMTLQTLSMNGTGLTSGSLEVIAEMLTTNTGLKTLNVASNEMGTDGCVALAKGLCANKSLTLVDFSSNQIMDDGAVALGNALGMNETLEVLMLNGNNIGDAGLLSLASQGLSKNETLTELHISGNRIGTDAIQALAFMLKPSGIAPPRSKLTRVDIRGMAIPCTAGHALAKSLRLPVKNVLFSGVQSFN